MFNKSDTETIIIKAVLARAKLEMSSKILDIMMTEMGKVEKNPADIMAPARALKEIALFLRKSDQEASKVVSMATAEMSKPMKTKKK